MIRKWWQNYLVTAGILFVLDWFLLWARFYWPGFGGTTRLIYKIINFPWSNLYFWIETRQNPWWYAVFGRRFGILLNDEVGPIILFLIIVLLQALIFTMIIFMLKKYWYKKRRYVHLSGTTQSKNVEQLTECDSDLAHQN